MPETTSARRESRSLAIYAAICIGVVAAVLFLSRIGVFDRLELTTQDMRFRIRGVEDAPDLVEIVAVDANTLDQLGLVGFPPREAHIPLIENLYAAGAKAVLFDVLFLVYTGTYDRESLGPIPSYADSMLADMFFFYPETVIGRKLLRTMDDATEQTVGESPLPPELFRNPGQLAFVDMIPDADSFVRRALLISGDGDVDPASGWQYSLGLRAAMYALDADTAWIDTGRNVCHVGDHLIPLERTSPPSMRINFAADERTFARSGGYISYEQVLDTESDYGLRALVDAGRIRDKVIIVGATYEESKDWQLTPFYLGNSLFSSSEYPMYGVHVHKSIADTIISGRFMPPTTPAEYFLLVAAMAVLATVLNHRFRGFAGLFLNTGLVVLYGIVAAVLFIAARRMIPFMAPAVAVVATDYVSVVTYHYLTERKQKAMIRGAFSQYVPGSVVDELLKNPEKLTLGGEERVMSVLFSDVAGFTTISEQLTPASLVELLNVYLTAMTDVVFRYDGIIDKYEGDAIMAEFGAPLPDEQHALKACLAAIDMQVELAALREKLVRAGKPPLHARIGINSGAMVVGNMGSSQTFDYTVMGDNVNLSSRLEGANKIYGTAIMISEATRIMAGDEIITRELDLLRVKGKTAGVLVHEVLGKRAQGIDPAVERMVEVYGQGLRAYRERRWDDGAALFARALELVPGDGPSAVYLDRCRAFRDQPPPDDWDGTFTMRTK